MEIDWLDVLEAGLREERPEWFFWRDRREFWLDGQTLCVPCLILGPWDAKVVVRGAEALVFHGCHRFQDRVALGDPLLLEKIVQRAELSGSEQKVH